MGKVEILSNVSDADVDEVVADFESEGATVTKKKEGNGWTVRAEFPKGEGNEETAEEEEDDE